MDLNEFKNPGKIYRPSPFWSWNDALDPEELRWQVLEFAEKGFGGYFMHSRVGLSTAYLSKEWMKCVRTCLEEGKKVNTESWLYDEDKWPSGFAGGIVPAKGDKYRSKHIQVRKVEAEEAVEALNKPSLLGIFRLEFTSPKTVKRFKRVNTPEEVKNSEELLLFEVKLAEKRNWHNGESYVDLLNPETTEEFLKVTHDAYAKEFQSDFGEFMPGIFTDEPNYARGNVIPWTDDLPNYFRKLNGYDILEKLPLLYFDGEGSRKVRYDFWKTVTQRFIEAFTIPYAQRCDRYGLQMTGHWLCEDTLDEQIRRIGAAMPHYEYMQLPGIDHLGRNIENPLTLKQCSSVAHQFGKTRILSELFGCSGHSMTFEDQKWIGDFHLVLGITFFCPHLTLYTMKGDAKRDFPPTFSYHQPYWEHFKLINDYFARASYLCSQGKFCADILVLHSIGSAWATFTPMAEGRDTPVWKYNDALVKIQDDLLALHRDFDYGDEIVLSRHGKIEGKEFVVKEARYKIVVVPPSLTWAEETVGLLEKFLDSGGTVIFVGETPSLIDGEPAEEKWRKILAHPKVVQVKPERQAIAKMLDEKLPRSIAVTDAAGEEIGDILVHHRVEGCRHIYFLVNTSRERRYDATITFSEKGEVTEWDMFNGSVSQVAAVVREGRTVIETTFHPTGSRAFVIDTSKPFYPETVSAPAETKEEIKRLPDEWAFERLHLNSLVLDACRYALEEGEWSEKKPVWKVRREVWKAAGLEKYAGIQPWVLIQRKVKPKPLKLRIRATFKSEVTGKRVFLVVEQASIWKISVNGKPVNTAVKEWHWDKQFNKIDISNCVKKGENVIELSCQYSLGVPIEDMYLVGDFGVKPVSETEYVLTDEPEALRSGNWVTQGYPFYTGTMRYKTNFTLKSEPKPGERVLIRFPEAKGTLFLVRVNGKDPVPVCWRPLEADVTSLVRKNENELTIDVVSSLRNTFGPLHHKQGDLHWVGPFSFTDEGNWTDAYQLVPYGLINGAELVIRRKIEKA